MSTYEDFFWLILPGRGAPARRADKKPHELKSFGRFWYQEIRDFLNSKRTVWCCAKKVPRQTVLVSIEADRPGAWFTGRLGPYAA
jgi:hypothetical protein